MKDARLLFMLAVLFGISTTSLATEAASLLDPPHGGTVHEEEGVITYTPGTDTTYDSFSVTKAGKVVKVRLFIGTGPSPSVADEDDFRVIDFPRHGVLAIEGTSDLIYTPNQGYSGSDTYTIQSGNSVRKFNISLPRPKSLSLSLRVGEAVALEGAPNQTLVNGEVVNTATNGYYYLATTPGTEAFAVRTKDALSSYHVDVTRTVIGSSAYLLDDHYEAPAFDSLVVASPGVLGNDTLATVPPDLAVGETWVDGSGESYYNLDDDLVGSFTIASKLVVGATPSSDCSLLYARAKTILGESSWIEVGVSADDTLTVNRKKTSIPILQDAELTLLVSVNALTQTLTVKLDEALYQTPFPMMPMVNSIMLGNSDTAHAGSGNGIGMQMQCLALAVWRGHVELAEAASHIQTAAAVPTLGKAPAKGDVTLYRGGAFLYTPSLEAENLGSTDSFEYSLGGKTATVSIDIALPDLHDPSCVPGVPGVYAVNTVNDEGESELQLLRVAPVEPPAPKPLEPLKTTEDIFVVDSEAKWFSTGNTRLTGVLGNDGSLPDTTIASVVGGNTALPEYVSLYPNGQVVAIPERITSGYVRFWYQGIDPLSGRTSPPTLVVLIVKGFTGPIDKTQPADLPVEPTTPATDVNEEDDDWQVAGLDSTYERVLKPEDAASRDCMKRARELNMAPPKLLKVKIDRSISKDEFGYEFEHWYSAKIEFIDKSEETSFLIDHRFIYYSKGSSTVDIGNWREPRTIPGYDGTGIRKNVVLTLDMDIPGFKREIEPFAVQFRIRSVDEETNFISCARHVWEKQVQVYNRERYAPLTPSISVFSYYTDTSHNILNQILRFTITPTPASDRIIIVSTYSPSCVIVRQVLTQADAMPNDNKWVSDDLPHIGINPSNWEVLNIDRWGRTDKPDFYHTYFGKTPPKDLKPGSLWYK